MPIRIFNTLTRQKELFEPITPGKVGIYLCGPTVYAPSHLGHMIGPVIFDVVKRHLTHRGYQVTLVINITDIDDKLIQQSAVEQCTVAELAKRVTADYWKCLDRLGVQVDHFPHATHYIKEMQSVIQTLIDKGHAYAVGGDVYFDVTTDDDYGKLSNRKLDEMLAGTRKEVSDLKRNAADFALWKGAKPGEPFWESPWGNGRPGWHIECTAMSMALLGETFDIHGGGLDLQFPHHEDEIAQSECCTGKLFARYWMHHGLLQTGGTKISKSLGNSIAMAKLFAAHSAEQIRFFILNTHYRSPIDYEGENPIKAATVGLNRLHTFRERLERILKQPFCELPVTPPPLTDAPMLREIEQSRMRFFEFLDDDFNTGAAIGVLFEMLSPMNRFADEARLETSAATDADRDVLRTAACVFRELTHILGILESKADSTGHHQGLTPKLLDLLLELRNEARKQKNFAIADAVRNRLKEVGVVIEDGPEGSRWKITAEE
jgi:cysteinyl-tRNA synthetase